MKPNIYLYILVMAGVTYLIRMLPLVLFKREITSPFVKSFLYYVPYACLAAMTFPAILTATAGGIISGAAGLIVALIVAYREKSLLTVALCTGQRVHHSAQGYFPDHHHRRQGAAVCCTGHYEPYLRRHVPPAGRCIDLPDPCYAVYMAAEQV